MSAAAPKALALAACLAACLALGAAPAWALDYEVESVSAQFSDNQAGAHADFTTAFSLTEEGGEPAGLTRDIVFELPAGIIGNPQGIPRCTTLRLGSLPAESECPVSSQVGVTEITLGGATAGTFTEPIYNMDPPNEDVVARLGFFAGAYPMTVNITVDPVDYGLIASIEGAPAAAVVISASSTLWGVPAAAVHDPQRITPAEALSGTSPPGGREAGLPEAPFMTNPAGCGSPGELRVTVTSYQFPHAPSSKSAAAPAIFGCDRVAFEPSFALSATNPAAAAPTGIDAELRLTREEAPNARATAPLKSAVVTLPAGMTINPAAADGLAACSAAEVGFERDEAAHCPDAAKIGTVEIDVPALARPLRGAVYQRTPTPGRLFGLWVVADELGVHLKLPAEIEADPASGQLTAVFAGVPSLGGNPQVPLASLKLHVFGGPRAPLVTPGTCGVHQSRYSFAPWSGNPAVEGDAAMQITAGCAKGGFSPTFTAGTLSSSAGRFSPFVLQLERQDGEANPAALAVTLPEGLLGKLAGIALCPEQLAPSGACPAEAQIGTATVAAGVGGAPLWIPQAGKEPTAVYLSGPYKGAPYSLVVKVPARAGPFDLGVVVNRAAIEVDPETTRITIASDPLPQILAGVPIAYRAIRVDANRPGLTLNPTDCSPKRVWATTLASDGQLAASSAPYQATDCAKLGFKPRLSLRLRGGTRRTKHPALRAVLRPRRANANLARTAVVLPYSQFIDNARIANPCTRVQFAARACPRSSVLGRARAFTPLLDEPLEGPIYFRSNGGERKLPDIVIDLRGQVEVTVVGHVDSVQRKGSERSRIRTVFAHVPDAPLSRLVVNFFGGKRGLLVNSENLCAKKRYATVKMRGQNGRVERANRRVGTSCKTARAKRNRAVHERR